MNTGIWADTLDLCILDALQEDIPLVPRPWETIAARLGIPEGELLERLGRLTQEGIVRGISPIIDGHALGLRAATLVALPVPDEDMRGVAELVSSYPEVSHNFRRDHRYSLWFTLSAKDEQALNRVLGEILDKTGFSREEILDLATVRKIKIDVRFPLGENRNGGTNGPA